MRTFDVSQQLRIIQNLVPSSKRERHCNNLLNYLPQTFDLRTSSNKSEVSVQVINLGEVDVYGIVFLSDLLNCAWPVHVCRRLL